MKVLFLSAVFPYPLVSGGHVRIFNLLKELGRRHDITLFAHVRSHTEERFIPHVMPPCRQVRVFYRGRVWQPKYIARALSSSLPLLLSSYENRELSGILTHAYVNSFDVIHCEPFYVAHVLPETNVPRVIAEHNIEYEVYKAASDRYRAIPVLSAFMQWDVAKMKSWEERAWRMSDRVVCVSDEDKRVIDRTVKGKVTVVPNGVDCSYFQFSQRIADPVRPRFLFVGNYRWFPNTEAVRTLLTSVWPIVRAAYPKATLTVAGSHMPDSMRRTGLKAGVTMLGWAEDIRAVYSDAHIFLAPLGIAGGSKFKILEAMATGLPVITTPEGATGLAVRDEEHVLTARKPQDFLRRIGELLDNRGRASHMARSARSLVEHTYAWDRIADILDTAWRNA